MELVIREFLPSSKLEIPLIPKMVLNCSNLMLAFNPALKITPSLCFSSFTESLSAWSTTVSNLRVLSLIPKSITFLSLFFIFFLEVNLETKLFFF